MYCITDQHIDYILDDLRRRGIETEDLQSNLLDHICCLAEHNLKEEDDFEGFYRQTITQFYKKELRELEEETILLLTFKNYYMMKKIMIAGGALSVLAFLSGSFFKVMHWPGASMLLTLGLLSLCIFFLPLVYIFKAKELNTGLEKLTVALGTLLGILFCLDILFSVNHWPGATALWLSTVSLSIFVFIPLYFFTGIHKPETRTNTILTTIVLVGFTGLLFTALNLRPSLKTGEEDIYSYLQNEQIWNSLQNRREAYNAPAKSILSISEKMKSDILRNATGQNSLPGHAGAGQLRRLLENVSSVSTYFDSNEEGSRLFEQLKAAVDQYNTVPGSSNPPIALDHSWLSFSAGHIRNYNSLYMLNSLTQLQIYLATSTLPPAAVALK